MASSLLPKAGPFGVDLEKSVKGSAVLSISFHLIVTAISIDLSSNQASSTYALWLACLFSANVVASLLLLVAVCLRNRFLLLPWLILNALNVVAVAVSVGLCVAFGSEIEREKPEVIEGFFTSLVVALTLICLCYIYSWTLVLALFGVYTGGEGPEPSALPSSSAFDEDVGEEDAISP